MKFERKDLFAYLAFLGLTLFFFSPFLSGEQIFAFKDLSRYFYPLRYLMVEQAQSGHFPLWNPYIFCGFPLLATLQICFFYPLSLIYYLLPFNLAFNYYIILHYFLAACFMHGLLRHYKLSQAASFLGGMVFVFSGYLLSVSNMNTSLSSAIWLPLVLLFFDRLIQTKNFINISFLGILLAVQFLGGEPTIIYITLLMLPAYAAVFSGSWKKFGQDLGGLALAGLIALGLTAVQVLPFIELVRLSDRGIVAVYELVTMRSFPPRELITFIFPYFYGNPAKFGGYSAILLGKVYQDWLISPYLGILPLVFVFLAFRQSHKKRILFFAATALVFLLLAFGKYTFLYRFAYLLPGIGLIRYPVKYLAMVTFCFVILASFGFDSVLLFLDKNREALFKIFRNIAGITAGLLLVFVFAYLFRLQIFLFFARQYPSDLHKFFFDELARMIEFNLLSFLFVIIYLFAFSLLLYLAYRKRVKQSVFVILIVLLVGADLFANGASIAVKANRSVFDEISQSFRLLQGRGLYRFFYTPELEQSNRSVYAEDYDSALFEVKDNISANWHIPYHLFDVMGYESIRPVWLYKQFPNFDQAGIRKNFRKLSFFNVKYLASSRPLDIPGLKLLRHKHKYGLDLYLYENSRALPRAFILDANGNPDLLSSSATVLKYEPQVIEIEAKLKQAGFLFLSEAYYPGWRVWVDGKESRILRAKEFFRKVKLSAGKHKVKFVYDPFSFKLGGWLSVMTILGLMLGGIFYSRKNK